MEDAQDLTQAFFAQFLDRNSFAIAQPERGKFRAFLLTSLKHFLAKEWDKSRAIKRGGDRKQFPLDFDSGEHQFVFEPSTNLTPDQLFDRQWATTLLSNVMQKLESELVDAGKGEQFGELKRFIIGDHAGDTYAAVACRLGMSEAAAKMSASRLRQRYRLLLRGEIAETVSSSEEVDEEIQRLFQTFED